MLRLLAALLMLICAPAWAQQHTDANGITIVQPSSSVIATTVGNWS